MNEFGIYITSGPEAGKWYRHIDIEGGRVETDKRTARTIAVLLRRIAVRASDSTSYEVRPLTL